MAQPYKQSLTYWPPGPTNGTGGMTFGAPQTIKGRWEDAQEEFNGPHDKIMISKAIVYMPHSLYADIMETQGYLYPGASVEANPKDVDGAYEIMGVIETPDLRNVRQELRVFL